MSEWSMWRKLCCCKEREDHRRRPRATPMPWGRLILVASVVFSGQFGTMLLFPFLPFMVQDFFPNLSKQELGQKAGYLGSAYFIGNFAGSMMWGWFSDLWGRRPVLLCGMCGLIVSELLFGFSQNFAWAVGARLMWGFLNGNLGVSKTYIAEICDDSNQARGFSVFGTTAGIGRLFGSVVGGFLARPASKYSLFEMPFFCKFPYLLPCLLGASIAIFCLIPSFLFLTETLQSGKVSGEEDTDVSDCSFTDDSGLELVSRVTSEDSSGLLDSDASDIQILESDVDSSSDFERVASDTELLVKHVRRTAEHRSRPVVHNPLTYLKKMKRTCQRNFYTCCDACNGECNLTNATAFLSKKVFSVGTKLKSMLLLMCDRRVLLTTTLYGLLSFFAIISNEVFPLLMVTSYHYGGYSMDDNEIGVVIMAAGFIQLSWQLFVYPYIPKYLGYRRTLQVVNFLFAIMIVLLPLVNRITGPVPGSSSSVLDDSTGSGLWSGSGSGSGFWTNHSTTESNTTFDYCGSNVTDDLTVHSDSIERVPFYIWITLVLFVGAVIVLRTSALTTVMVLISNSALPMTRGSVNGIGQSLSSVGRTLGPIVGSLLFAWSEGNGFSWPLNYNFTFYVIAMVSLFAIGVSLFLPKTIEKKRETLGGEQ